MLYSGQLTPPRPTTLLRAGAFTMHYEPDSGSLRYIKLGEHEVLRRIYAAVRDPNWDTIPARITLREMTLQTTSFMIRYQAEHQQTAGGIYFVWEGTIRGDADSTLIFSMDGAAQSTFLSNRIGFCILHPMTCAGTACRIEHVDDTFSESFFPVEIEPHQPFLNFRAIRHPITAGVQAEVRFTGDIFEMEDQRNWTDASYKTYGTPLALPIPVEIAAGTQIQQSVALHLVGEIPADATTTPNVSAPLQVTITNERIGELPRLGVASASHGKPLTPREIERLRMLHLSHLRVDVRFDQPNWSQQLAQVVIEAELLNLPLETALHLSTSPAADLVALRSFIDTHPFDVSTWLLFQQGQVCTPPEIAALARQYLGVSARFAGGTDAFFVQLNRERPPVTDLNLLTFSISPQVHAFDNATMIENLPAQAATLNSARLFNHGRSLMVSPVTLKLRHNPASLRPNVNVPAGMLPPQVDARQVSLFGAGWTLGSIKSLRAGGATSITYYETTGWLGVMERESAFPTDPDFLFHPGEVFPMFHTFADVGEFAGGELLRAQSSDPLRLEAFALRRGERVRLLLANFTPQPQTVLLHGLEHFDRARLSLLDEHSASDALRQPEAFRLQTGERLPLRDHVQLELAPFALARLDMMSITQGDSP